MPFSPATTFYEAIVATNFLFYLDGCDDLGRFDQDLWPYYRDDLAAGRVTHDEALAWVRQLFQNVDTTFAWNCAIGGTAADGSQGSNALTLVCLEAAKGRRRPNLALRLRRDTPEEVWEQALETISGGSGIPALYNEEEYVRRPPTGRPRRRPRRPAALRLRRLHRTDDPRPLQRRLARRHLQPRAVLRAAACTATSPPARPSTISWRGSSRTSPATSSRCATQSTRNQKSKALAQPQPIRTLLVDDCLDNAMEFNAGGARYNWSVICIAGLANTYDSLAAIRADGVRARQAVSARGDCWQALRDDFAGHEALRQRLQRCPHYGNDDPFVDDLAVDAQHLRLQRVHGPDARGAAGATWPRA